MTWRAVTLKRCRPVVTPGRLSAIASDRRLLAVTDLHPSIVAVITMGTMTGTMTVRSLTTEEVAERFRASLFGPGGIRLGRGVLYDEAECDRWWQTKVTAAGR